VTTHADTTHSSGAAPRHRDGSRQPARTWTEGIPWISGLIAGLMGASLVALIFLGIDIAQRQALWTPAALGSALFLSERLPVDADPPLGLAFGYTLLHVTGFIAVGAVASWWLTNFKVPLGAVGMSLLLFVTFEALFLLFAGIFEPRLISVFGVGTVTGANALSAVVMGYFLVRSHARVQKCDVPV